MGTITPGRKPTLGEVIEYYTREDFLTFLKHLLTTTRVVTVIPRKLHWEPNWKEDEVIGDTLESLRLSILSKILILVWTKVHLFILPFTNQSGSRSTGQIQYQIRKIAFSKLTCRLGAKVSEMSLLL